MKIDVHIQQNCVLLKEKGNRIMKRIKKRRRINWVSVSVLIWAVTGILYLGTSVGLRTYNSYLNVQKQDYERQIAALKKDNEVAQMEVNQLSTYDRIMEIAAKDGMKSYNGNVITVYANE